MCSFLLQEVLALRKLLLKNNVQLKLSSRNLIDDVWGRDMPPHPNAPIRIHPEEYAGFNVVIYISKCI